MKQTLLSFITILIFSTSWAQTIPASRLVDWSNAGLRHVPETPTTVVNFEAYGGFKDGITPNDSLIQALLDSLKGDTALIYFPAGKYFFSQTLSLHSNLVLQGAGSDSTVLLFNMATESNAILLQGQLVKDTVSVTANIYKDDPSITVDTLGNLTVGDHILIAGDDDSLVTSSWALRTTGQINIVDSLSGNQVFLRSTMRRDFQVQKNITVVRIDPVMNIGIEQLKIQRLDPTASQTSNIRFQYASNCWVKCVESDKCNFAHLDARYSTNLLVYGSYFHGGFDFGGGGKAYGVMIEFSSGECFVYDNIFDTLRHSMIMQAGANGNVFAYNYSANPYWDDPFLPSFSAGDLVLHGNYVYSNLLEGNTVQNIVIDDSHGQNGPLNTFFRNRGELYGIFMNFNPPSDSQNFVGNEITTSGSLIGNYYINGTGHFEYGNNQLGNIRPVGTDALQEQTLFFDTIPGYYAIDSIWPPIGIPNANDSHIIEAEERYQNGEFTLCAPKVYMDTTQDTTINVIEITNEAAPHIYPNPTREHLVIQLGTAAANTQAFIFDAQGKLIMENQLTSGTNLLKLPPNLSGIYLVKVVSGTIAYVNKVVIQP